MTITLEEIKKEQNKLVEMIAKFETQTSTQYVFPEARINLRYGERYAGLILDDDGAPSHHLILLPGGVELSWEDATAWADRIDGGLPTRHEQSLLFANLRDQFDSRGYWSCVQYAEHSDYAWSQDFGYGSQHCGHKGSKHRARAVRRVEIK